jgi:hypothetical protein
MRLIPSKRVIEKFLLTYELKGCQKAVNFLTEYYAYIVSLYALSERGI